MFGTSGIRGLYGKEVTEELALKIGNIFSEKDVVVGRDIRNTGESLENAVISGVLSTGKNAISLGIVPTPTLALVTKKLNCNGIQITASHNPPEYNGLKLFSNGIEISREEEKKITEKYEKNEINYSEWNKLGKLKKYSNAVQEHKQLIIGLIDQELISNKKPKVIVDSNGPGAVITPSLLKELGCEVISMNDSLEKFSRKSEPNKENLKGLSEKVKEENADLGIGHDGDADRTVVVDETGEVLALDVQLAMMIEYELERIENRKPGQKTKNEKNAGRETKNKRIITTVEASLCVREAVEKNNAEIIITPVGSLYVSEELEKENGIFGGEPCGEYVFRRGVHVPDGILSAGKFVEMFCKKGKLSKLKNKYKPYSMLREKFECKNEEKYKLVGEIKKEIEKLGIKGKIRNDDGVRIDEEDGWFLIRASGTEPYIRLTIEYTNNEKLRERTKELGNLVKSCI